MAKDLFGGLGGLVKGLSSFMPQDDPNVQLLNAQTEASEYAAQEQDLYAQIGKTAIQKYGLDSFGELADKLRLVQTNLAAAQSKLQDAQGAMATKEKADKQLRESRTCPACGHENPEGVKFCQECGAKVGIVKNICPSCGMENAPGTRFCGECGTRLEEER